MVAVSRKIVLPVVPMASNGPACCHARCTTYPDAWETAVHMTLTDPAPDTACTPVGAASDWPAVALDCRCTSGTVMLVVADACPAAPSELYAWTRYWFLPGWAERSTYWVPVTRSSTTHVLPSRRLIA